MGQNPINQLNNLRERIENSDDIDEEDQEVLLAFDDKLALLSADYSDLRRLKLLNHVTIMAEQHGGIAAALEDREIAENLVRWINRNYDVEETNRDYRVALRVFGRRVSDENGDDPPYSLEWVPSGTSGNYDPAPDPAKMLDWEDDILPMIDATRNSRDAAAIALEFDAGLRGFEFRDLTIGSVTDHTHGLQVTVNGKQGRRTVTLIPSVPYVNRWLSDHPAPDDGEAPLWSMLHEAEALSYNMLLRMFSDPGERAGITKPVTPTNFRKSSASHLASRGMNQAHIEDHHGWVRGSKVAARYVTVFAEDADRELARIHGLEVEEDEPEPLAPLACPRCEKETPRDKELCVWCGQALTPDAANKAEKLDDILFDSIAEADAEDTERLLRFRDIAKSDPELRADAISGIQRLLEEN